ncbi:MAG: hypothetical protein ACYS76_11305 [Planctomycetota bacterium]
MKVFIDYVRLMLTDMAGGPLALALLVGWGLGGQREASVVAGSGDCGAGGDGARAGDGLYAAGTPPV